MEGWERGARWRRWLGVGALHFSDDTFDTLAKGVAKAAKLGGKPAEEYGLKGGKEGLLARVSIANPTASPTP